MNWLLLTLISAVTSSLSRILQKTLLKHDQSDPFAFSIIFQLTVAGIFLLYCLVTGTFELPNISDLWLNLIVLAVFYSLGNLCVFKAFKYADASEVSIIFASSTVWSVIAAMILLGEQLTKINILGIALIVGGVAAINYSPTKWQFNKGHLIALAGAVLFGVAFTNDAYIIGRYQNVAPYMVLAFTLPGITTLLYKPKSVKHLAHFFQPITMRNLLVCCLFYAVAAITIFTAYTLGGKASIISPIQQTSIIFTVVFSYFILKEKNNMTNKLIGTALAFVGVLLLI